MVLFLEFLEKNGILGNWLGGRDLVGCEEVEVVLVFIIFFLIFFFWIVDDIYDKKFLVELVFGFIFSCLSVDIILVIFFVDIDFLVFVMVLNCMIVVNISNIECIKENLYKFM